MQNGTFGLSQDSLTRYLLIHVAFLTISNRDKFINFFVFLYFRSSVQSPDTKRAHIRPQYVSLIEVKYEIKPASIISTFQYVFCEFYT